MTISPTFRAQFANLTEAEALTVLGWLLEPGIDDPEPEMSEALIDALAPVTKAYTEAYTQAERIVTGEDEHDRAADYGDWLYEQRRDQQMIDRMGGLEA
ncbi:MAG: hypothetical protein WCL10_18910 [Novosphingobium sp.]|uniref:hypothetical protein n=1 Tax=Novosphingobium sp. TaxID=1874826 RepID=UPI003018975E